MIILKVFCQFAEAVNGNACPYIGFRIFLGGGDAAVDKGAGNAVICADGDIRRQPVADERQLAPVAGEHRGDVIDRCGHGLAEHKRALAG